jgi:hypothetical protein
MADRPDKDRMVHNAPPRESPQPKAPSSGSLPTTDPDSRTLDEQQRDLQRLIEQTEDVLRYMGAAHPQRTPTADRLEKLREMMRRLDNAIKESPQRRL